MDLSLVDILAHGLPFTWSNCCQEPNTIFETLDCGYSGDLWQFMFSNAIIHNLKFFIGQWVDNSGMYPFRP